MKSNINAFLRNLGPVLDHNMCRLENYLLIGDFSSEITEIEMKDFCETYNLENLVIGPTCFKNPLHPSSTDLMLTNQIGRFQNIVNIASGLSDHRMMTIGVMKSFVLKQTPSLIRYRCYRKFNSNNFGNELLDNLETLNENARFVDFESKFMKTLNKHAPVKTKFVRANNAPLSPKSYLRIL